MPSENIAEILNATPAYPPLEQLVSPDGVVAIAVLGEHNGYTAYGVLTNAGRACLALLLPNELGSSTCSPQKTFEKIGISVSHGEVGLTWYSDDTILWD